MTALESARGTGRQFGDQNPEPARRRKAGTRRAYAHMRRPPIARMTAFYTTGHDEQKPTTRTICERSDAESVAEYQQTDRVMAYEVR